MRFRRASAARWRFFPLGFLALARFAGFRPGFGPGSGIRTRDPAALEVGSWALGVESGALEELRFD